MEEDAGHQSTPPALILTRCLHNGSPIHYTWVCLLVLLLSLLLSLTDIRGSNLTASATVITKLYIQQFEFHTSIVKCTFVVHLTSLTNRQFLIETGRRISFSMKNVQSEKLHIFRK